MTCLDQLDWSEQFPAGHLPELSSTLSESIYMEWSGARVRWQRISLTDERNIKAEFDFYSKRWYCSFHNKMLRLPLCTFPALRLLHIQKKINLVMQLDHIDLKSSQVGKPSYLIYLISTLIFSWDQSLSFSWQKQEATATSWRRRCPILYCHSLPILHVHSQWPILPCHFDSNMSRVLLFIPLRKV